jgi:hypothetical protein
MGFLLITANARTAMTAYKKEKALKVIRHDNQCKPIELSLFYITYFYLYVCFLLHTRKFNSKAISAIIYNFVEQLNTQCQTQQR